MTLKNNKGFSFVEMLTIVVILAIVALAAYPVIQAIVRSSKTKLYKQNVVAIERASKSWAIEHADDLPNDMSDARFLTLTKLAEQGYLKNKYVFDPRNDKAMTGCVVVKKNNQEQYMAEYTKEKCEIAGKKYLPKIKVLKNSSKTYELNSEEEYIYPVLSAKTILGEEIEIPEPIIKKNGKVVPRLKNNNLKDKYKIVYKIKDPNNELVKTKEFDVKITDKTAPVITVLNQTKGFDEVVTVNTDYQIPKAIVTDNSNSKVKLSVSTNINLKLKGDYEIVYKAIDASDNIGLLVMNVKVTDNKLLTENEIIVSNASVLPGDGKLVSLSNNEYVFKGTNPNNFIKYNNELWRIIKIDQNGIKIVKKEPLMESVWSNKNNIALSKSIVEKILKDYYKTLDKTYVNDNSWNIGYIDLTKTADINSLKRSESVLSVKKEEMAGLINMSDYISASSNDSCNITGKECNKYNYLTKDKYYFTLQANKNNEGIYVVGKNDIQVMPSSLPANIYPVLYLKGYKTLLGTGTITDPYIINK